MKSKSLEWPVGLRISTPKVNEILEFTVLNGLKPIIESDSSLYGDHLFGVQEFFFKEEVYLSPEAFLVKIKELKGVGRQVWSYLWDEAGIHIPEAWKRFILYFGEIFENKVGKRFLLCFFFNESENKWEYVFEQLHRTFIPNRDARMVCLG